MRRGLGIAVLTAIALAVTACGSSGSSGSKTTGGSGSGGGGGSSSASVSGAKTLQASALDNPPKGTITYCTGKDTTGDAAYTVAQFNAKYGAQGYHANLVQFPASADQQRAQFIQRQQAKSSSCDVFSSDVIWTAEFSSQHWLYDLTPYVSANASKFIAAPLDTVHYGGKYWGIPQTSDAAFIYYKTGEAVPSTWQQVYSAAKNSGGIVYQGAPYEGLTCNFLELAFAAGGQVLSADGKKSVINSPQNLAALQLMVSGIKGGSAPQAVTTYMEPESDQAFDTGKYGYLRNWTYAYAVHNTTGALKGKIHAAPLPTFAGAGKASILGGHNSVISVYSQDPGLALKFADFFASPAMQKAAILKFSLAAIIPSVYKDPDVLKAVPYAPQLLQALDQAKARPVSPVYPQISQAIYTNVNNALAGRESPQAALKAADSQINSALSTF